MRIRVINSLQELPSDSWNRLAGTKNPFVRYEFLRALEDSGCVRAETGWYPQHMLLEDDTNELIAAAPMYLKSHSYGEYVFDWAWADAYERSGHSYYPKLVCAVPFSPVSGPRILAPTLTTEIVQALSTGARELADARSASSVHWLFTSPELNQHLIEGGYLQRTGFQYHWQNRNYASFDEFLGEFSSDKRKKVRRERRLVREQGVRMEIVEGADMTDELWDRFYAFYRSTILNHGAIAYLNREFFSEIGRNLADAVVMVLAWQDKECIAGSINLKGDDALYGRYWGSDRFVDQLHFETCYYSAIEYCIANGLQRFEAGAKGGHKLSRGFLPTPTYSMHWLRHPEFSDAVERYLQQEQDGIEYQLNELNEHTPFKRRCE
jgi:predicted N-acyltransferase